MRNCSFIEMRINHENKKTQHNKSKKRETKIKNKQTNKKKLVKLDEKMQNG